MRYFFLLSFTFVCFSLAAQQVKSVNTLQWKEKAGLSLHSIGNQDQTCTFIVNVDSIKAFLLSKDDTAAELFTVPVKYSEKYLGGFIKNDKVYLFMDNGSSAGLHTWLYDINSKSVKEGTVPFDVKKEKILHRLSSNHHFFYLTLNEKSPEFFVYSFTDEKHIDTIHNAIDEGIWETMRMKNVKMQDDNAYDMEPVATNNFESVYGKAKHSAKLYIRNDSLLLLLNKAIGRTDIYAFNLEDKKATYRFIKHAPEETSANVYTDNSYLLGDKLYFASATQDSLLVQVTDFSCGTIIKEFRADSSQEISFNNSTLVDEDNNAFKKDSGSINAKRLLDVITDGCILLHVSPDSLPGRVQITIGAYTGRSRDFLQERLGLQAVPFNTYRNYVPGSLVLSPVLLFLPIGKSGYLFFNSASFKMLLNAQSAEALAGAAGRDKDGIMRQYIKDNKINYNYSHTFIHHGQSYLTYFDKKNHAVMFVQF